jgi:uncharacterized protein YidB (DUF937 family)
MGLLDDVLGSAVPGGGLAKPLMIAATALLAAKATGGLGGLLGGSGATAANQPPGPPGQPEAPQPAAGQPGGQQGGLLGGLAGLVEQFRQNGHGDVINSWIGSGQNQPVAPEQLHQALGPDAVNNLSRMTGVSGQDLVAELSRVLPGIVDKLTPQGRVPDHAEMSRW